MNVPATCPQCGLELPAGSSSWLCPKCVLAQAASGGVDERGTVPVFGAEEVAGGDVSGEAFPRTLGDYQLLERIGQGGMGVVFKARQLGLDRVVAVKMLPSSRLASKEHVLRFRTEAVAAGSLQHPGIVAIHEVGLDEGQHYLVMEYVAGPTLAEVARHGPLPGRRAARYVQLIAEAVDFAHERGILHRDLKPSNVLIDANDQPRVTDFGLAKRLESQVDLTLSGQVLGSPGYMPPEQASGQRGRVGRRSDVYSLGAILYHLLTGRPPFAGPEVADALRQVLHDEPVAPRLLNPKAPVDLETICLKCLEKEPARRYPTAHALAEELGRYLRDEPILSRPVSRIQKTWRWCRRRPAMAALTASVVALLLVLGVGGPILARQQRGLAERNRRRAYASDLKVAYQTWDLGDMPRAVELLDRNRPESGQTDLREFTWYYLRRLCEPYLRTPTLNHGSPVFMLSASRDGRWLAASGAGDWVTLWDLTDPTVSRRFHTGDQYAGCTAFSPDNRLLVTIGGPLDGPSAFNVWDTESGARLFRKETRPRTTIDFSPDGATLAAGQGQEIVLLDVRDWSELRIYRGHKDRVWDVRFDPSGRRLASCDLDRKILLRDAGTGEILHTLTGHVGVVYAVAFAPPDGRRLASAGDSTVRLWDLETGEQIDGYAHASRVMGVDVSPDGTTVASGSHDGLVKLWNPATGQIRSLRGHSHAVGEIRFVLGGAKLASSSWDGTVKLWDLQELGTQDELEVKWAVRSWSGMGRPPLAFSPDGSHVHTVSTGGDAVLIWRTASGALLHRWQPDRESAPLPGMAAGGGSASLVELAVSPRDGTCAVACEFQPPASAQTSHVVELWHIAEGRRAGAFPGRIPLRFSPDGSWLAAGGLEARTLTVTNLIDGRSWTAVLDGMQDRVDAVAFSPDSRLLAAACEGELHLYETGGGRLVSTLTRWTDAMPINALVFAPDGKTLAVGRFSPKVELWDVGGRRLMAELPGHLAQVTSLAISPDGKTLASGSENGTLQLWGLQLREELLNLQAHAGEIPSLAFSPDGDVLASAGDASARGGESIVRLWRAAPREP